MNTNALFDNALGSLKYAQAGLLVASQNVSGATVDGFVRRTPESLLSSYSPDAARPGQGLDGFGRDYSSFLQRQLLRQTGETAYSRTLSASTLTLDKMLTDQATSISGAMGSFFNAAGSLANEPGNPAYRESLIGSARQLSSRINTASDVLNTLREDSARGLEDSLRQANDVMSQLSRVNAQIQNAPSPDVFDERDRLGMHLQRLLGGNSVLENDGTLSHQINGVQVVEGASAYRFVNGDGSEPLVVRTPLTDNIKLLTPSQGSQAGKLLSVLVPQGSGSAQAPARSLIERGQAGAYITLLNEELPGWQRSLDLMAADLARQANKVQGANGQIQPLFSFSSATSGAAPLSSPTDFAAKMGFVLSGSETSAAQTNSTTLSLTAATSASVKDYRVYINGVDSGATVVTDDRTNALTLDKALTYAQGAKVEFRGTVSPYLSLLESSQAASRVVSGTEARVAGSDTKSLALDAAAGVPVTGYRVFVGGLDTGATVLQDNRSNTLTLDKSINYTAGDAVEFRAVSNLTLQQSLAEGVFSASRLQVQASSEDSQFTGFDATAAKGLEALRGSFNTPITSFTSRIASTLSGWNQDLQLNQTLERSLNDQKSSVSGVNLDEEAANLVRYQQLYAAASKMVQMGSQMFDTLMGMMSGR